MEKRTEDGRPERRARTVALIAHDGKKDEMLRLAQDHAALLRTFRLVATRSTGEMIADGLGIYVDTVGTGPEGGDLQIGARIVEGTIDAVVFLRDPLTAHPHDPDIQALLKVCDVHQVPLATNRSTAEILLTHLTDDSATVGRTNHPSVVSKVRFGKSLLRA